MAVYSSTVISEGNTSCACSLDMLLQKLQLVDRNN